MGFLDLPAIIVTGASGFIGRHFLEVAKDKFKIFAIARRSQNECKAPFHSNIEWNMVDIADKIKLEKIIKGIGEKHRIDFILHLAGYYDFDCLESSEYDRTNVKGTKNLLELAKELKIKRFIFSSSLTICDFRKCVMPVTEKSPPNAQFPYAVSKRIGEEMLMEYSDSFSCTAIRFAAVFSDWCEYEPLYSLMSTWVSGKWNSRIIGGRGETAITYIHIKCAVLFILKVIEKDKSLKKFDILIATGSKTHSHKELFELTTRLFFGTPHKPVFIPKYFAAVGIFFRCFLGRLLKKKPFEKIWMVNYIDRFISANPEYSFNLLDFDIRERYSLPRRMIYLIENMKSFRLEWDEKNLKKTGKDLRRPNLLISDAMSLHKEVIVNHIHKYLSTSHDHPNYQSLDPDKLKWFIELVYNLLMGAVRNSDRHSVISYYRYLASIRKKGGFSLTELKSALLMFGEIVIEHMEQLPELKDLDQYLNDQIRLTFEMAADEVDDAYSEIPDQTNTDDENGRFNLSEEMTGYEQKIVNTVLEFLTSGKDKTRFSNYRKKSKEELRWHITLIYKLIIGCVRHNDNISFISYIKYLASVRKKEGFPETELIDALCTTVNISIDEINKFSKIIGSEKILENSIRPNIDRVSDEIAKVYSESVII